MITYRNGKKFGFLIFCLAFALTLCGAAAAAPTNNTHTNISTSLNQTTNLVTNTITTNNNKLSKTTATLNDPQIYKNGKPVSVPGFKAGHVFLTIAGAVNAAQSGDTIMLANGGTFAANNLNITKNLNFNVFNNGKATINANNKGSVFIINKGVTVNLQNLIIENGEAANGGAINNEGTLIAKNCVFKYNKATSNIVGGGGAIYNDGVLNVRGCIFLSNIAKYGQGGAIYSEYNTVLTTDSFTNNTSNNGGAIYNDNGYLSVTGSTFVHNQALADGGAIEVNAGILDVNTSIFKDNTAIAGAGIYSNTNSNIDNSIFTNNIASQYGGAIGNSGMLTLKGNTFDDNTAIIDGGAIYTNNGNISANFNRIVGNIASYGSAMYSNNGNVNAILNWWGYNSAANVAKEIYNNGGIMTYNPWIILTITANPASVSKGGSSSITAELLYSSDGKYHDPANGAVPYTGSANFKATKGTILNYKIIGAGIKRHVVLLYFSKGKTTSNLSNLNSPGITFVTAKVDGQLVTTSVTIK